MKRLIVILLSLILITPLLAQKRNTQQRRQTTTQVSKAKQQQTKKKTTTAKKATATKKPDRKMQLQNQQAATTKARKQSQAQLAQLNKNVKASLDSVLVLDHQIGRHQTSIDSLGKDIALLDSTILTLNNELGRLQDELELKRQRYSKALVKMRRSKSIQSKLMFVLSANNFSQLARRVRYLKEYSTFQKAQGELLKEKQMEVRNKQNELLDAKAQKETKLHEVETTKRTLQGLKQNCQTQVDFLNKNIATVQSQIKQYQEKEAALNAEIDRIIQAEIEAARRAEAERKKREEAERKKAEEAARANARRLANAKAAADRARKAEAEALAARKRAKTDAEKAAASQAAERAKTEMKAAEAEVEMAKKEEKAARAKAESWKSNDAGNARLSGNFASNKGRLPMPITGDYRIVGHFGNYTVAGLRNVTLNNKGIDIRGQRGCQARAVFDGVVSKVFAYRGSQTVMLRHGTYITVYTGLSSVSVREGQKVSMRQSLGTIGADSDGHYVLNFQLRKESNRLNPEAWLK